MYSKQTRTKRVLKVMSGENPHVRCMVYLHKGKSLLHLSGPILQEF